MHKEAYEFVAQFAVIKPTTVIEIGSRNINGTARDHFLGVEWTGLDIRDGILVDWVGDAADYDPPSPVDMVISCEVLEHAENWQALVAAGSRWLRTGGIFVLTCAGPGRAVHSGVDGGFTLHEGEHYGNVSAGELRNCMTSCGLVGVRAASFGSDTQAFGFKA